MSPRGRGARAAAGAGPVPGLVPLGVARSLRHASREDAAIYLAYVHNRADAWVSLAPALAGALILATEHDERVEQRDAATCGKAHSEA